MQPHAHVITFNCHWLDYTASNLFGKQRNLLSTNSFYIRLSVSQGPTTNSRYIQNKGKGNLLPPQALGTDSLRQ